MSTPKKSTKAAGVKPEALENFIPLFSKNVARIAELQKKSLEIAAQQNAEFVETCKNAFDSPETPGLFFFDLFGQTFDKVVEAQKSAIDAVVEQSHAAADLAKERAASFGKVAEGVNSLFQHTVEQSVAAQKKGLEYFAEQGKTACETAKKQFKVPTPFADAFQTGFDVLIETQKTILDLATRPLKQTAA